MHDDYGNEPSWPVAMVVGTIVFVVGAVVRVRNWVRRLWGGPKRCATDEQKPSDPPEAN